MLADTDVATIDERILKLGLKWRFLAAKKLPYQEEKSIHLLAIKDKQGRLSSAQSLPLGGMGSSSHLALGNIQEGNWPTH